MTDTPHAGPLPEMPCRDIVDVVTDYLDDALTEIDRRRLEEHLRICDDCMAYVDQVRATVAATGRAEANPSELPDELREGLRRAFRGWTG